MQKILLCGGIVLCCISQALSAGEKVDQTLKAEKDAYIEINHVNGYAEIRAWDKAAVRVVGELGDSTKEFIFELKGDKIVIKVKAKNAKGWNDRGSDDCDSDCDSDKLAIFVPKGSKVNYSSLNANVEGYGIEGGVQFDTINGEIEVKNLAGRIRLESVNGNISASKFQGDINIETVNGDIHSTSNRGKEGRYYSVNGDIDLVLSDIKHLKLHTVYGTVKARLNLLPGGEVIASSVDGPINLYFQAEVSARFDIRGHGGGRIINKFSDDPVQSEKYGPSRWLAFSLNQGDGKVNLSTVNGRVRLDTL